MIRSLFIVSTGGEVIIEKHWRGYLNRMILDNFFVEVRAKSDPKDIPPILAGPKFYITHIFCGDLFLVCPIQQDTPPLLIFEWMNRIVDIFKDYFSDFTEDSIKNNFVSVYQLLDEMMDSGIPFTMEPNILKEIIAPPSFKDIITGGSAAKTLLPDGTLSNIPWRKAGVKHMRNEMFFDIIEEMDCIYDCNGLLISSEIVGKIVSLSRLSGMPDLTLRFTNPRLLDDASFHPCVRYNRWEREKVISFVPPDGEFKLMEYRVQQQIQPPMYCKATVSFTETGGTVNIMVGPKNNMGKQVEDVEVTIPFSKAISSTNLTATYGTIHYEEITKICTWKIGKMPANKTPILSGNVSVTPGSSVTGCHPTALVKFTVNMFAVSGLKVDSLAVLNEDYKTFKGVRSITKAGYFEVRT